MDPKHDRHQGKTVNYDDDGENDDEDYDDDDYDYNNDDDYDDVYSKNVCCRTIKVEAPLE